MPAVGLGQSSNVCAEPKVKSDNQNTGCYSVSLVMYTSPDRGVVVRPTVRKYCPKPNEIDIGPGVYRTAQVSAVRISIAMPSPALKVLTRRYRDRYRDRRRYRRGEIASRRRRT